MVLFQGDGQTVLNVDERCLSCCGKAQTVLSGRTAADSWYTKVTDIFFSLPGFKMACLQYSPAPVLFAYTSLLPFFFFDVNKHPCLAIELEN